MIHSCGQITETVDARTTTLNVEMEKKKRRRMVEVAKKMIESEIQML